MSFTKAEARDAINKLIYDALMADDYTSDLKIFFDDDQNQTDGKSSPDALETWIEINVKHNESNRNSLSGDLGQINYLRAGVVVVNIYTPSGDGLKSSDIISEIAMSAYEGKANGSLWFRNTSSNEIGTVRAWFLTSVITEFQYDQIK